MDYGAAPAPETPAEEDGAAESTSKPDVDLPTLEEVVGWYEDWEERTRTDRELSARDYAYYDNEQWTQEELDQLKLTGQPVLTKNRISRKANFVLGDQEEKGVDPVARPKTPQHEDDARAATDALRATEEGQDFDTARSAGFKDLLIAGYMGALVEGDPDVDAPTCAPLTQIQWSRLWWDPHSCRPDFSDARYRGIVVWQDLDDAISDYPDSADVLRAAVDSNDSYGQVEGDKPTQWTDKRDRVAICEVYFRAGDNYYRGCFTGCGAGAWLKKPELTGYLDERQKKHVCPLVMASCYVADATNARYGIVRALISPQDEVNKRDSKSLHLLSVNGAIAERDAVTDPQKFLQELAKPDGFAEVEPGRLTDGSVQIRAGAELAAAQMQMSQQARADIDGIGPSSAGLPDLPQGASGKAFAYRQKSAAKEMAPVFASLRRWDIEVMRQNWMRICQFRTEEWWLRVTDDQELTGYRFVALNQRMTRAQRFQELLEKGVPPPKALETAAGEFAPVIMQQVQMMLQAQQAQSQQQQAPGAPPAPPQAPPDPTQAILSHPIMQEAVTLNQAAKMGVDIMIDTTSESAVLEDEEFQAVTEVLPTVANIRPDLAPVLLEVMFEASHFRSKSKIMQALKKPPDQQAQQAQQAMQQIQMAGAKAGVTVQETQAELNKAKAAQAQAQAQTEMPKAQADIEAKKAGAMHDAATAGLRSAGGM